MTQEVQPAQSKGKRKKRQAVANFTGPESNEPRALSEPTELRHWQPDQTKVVMTARWEEITPEYARHVWNHQNRANRGLRLADVGKIQSAIQNNAFAATGQPIIFDSAGDLQDGQHRIYAVALTGKPIVSLVVRGAPTTNFTKIDIGSVRNAADTLQVRGVQHAQMVASIIRNHRQFEANNTVSKKGLRMTNEDVLKYSDERPDVQQSAAYVVGITARKNELVGLTATQVGFIHYVTSGYNKVAADEFARLLVCPGAELFSKGENKEVVRHLRDRLSSVVSYRNRHGITGSLSAAQVIGMTMAAWNVFCRIGRRPIKKFQAPKMVNTGKIGPDGKPLLRYGMPSKVLTPSKAVVDSLAFDRVKAERVAALMDETYPDQELVEVQSEASADDTVAADFDFESE